MGCEHAFGNSAAKSGFSARRKIWDGAERSVECLAMMKLDPLRTSRSLALLNSSSY